MRHRLLGAALALALVTVGAPRRADGQSAPLWRTVEMARQLRDTNPQRIRVQYAVGRVDVRPAAAPVLYDMHLRYDERRDLPVHRYDAEQHATVLGVDARDDRGRPGDRKDTGELRVGLPATVPLDLDLEFGGTESTIELGGMMLRSVRMESGASESTVSFGSPNRTHMREMDIDVGAASLSALHLGNANADLIRVRGGVGDVDLDFGGTWARDLTVNTRLAIGQLTLRVPPSVGVRLEVQRVVAGFTHPGMTQRGDAWYSDNWESAKYKLRLRAETYFGEIEVRPVGP